MSSEQFIGTKILLRLTSSFFKTHFFIIFFSCRLGNDFSLSLSLSLPLLAVDPLSSKQYSRFSFCCLSFHCSLPSLVGTQNWEKGGRGRERVILILTAFIMLVGGCWLADWLTGWLALLESSLELMHPGCHQLHQSYSRVENFPNNSLRELCLLRQNFVGI